jgi:hypothetical protein
MIENHRMRITYKIFIKIKKLKINLPETIMNRKTIKFIKGKQHKSISQSKNMINLKLSLINILKIDQLISNKYKNNNYFNFITIYLKYN